MSDLVNEIMESIEDPIDRLVHQAVEENYSEVSEINTEAEIEDLVKDVLDFIRDGLGKVVYDTDGEMIKLDNDFDREYVLEALEFAADPKSVTLDEEARTEIDRIRAYFEQPDIGIK